jgi:acyl carrier protein
MSDNVVQEVVKLLKDVLRLGSGADNLQAGTALLGGLPEFDSMAVVAVVTALEEHFGFAFDDDEIRGEAFETVGTLAALVQSKLDA